MDDAKSLFLKLKDKLQSKIDSLDQMADPSSDAANDLKEEIEELTVIVEYYDTIIKKLEAIKTNDPEKQKLIDEQWRAVADRIQFYNDSRVVESFTLGSTRNRQIATEIDKLEKMPEKLDTKSEEDLKEEVEVQPEKKSSDNAYIDMMNDRAVEVSRRIFKLRQREKRDFTGRTTAMIMGLDQELNQIRESIKNYDDRRVLDAETEKELAAIDSQHDELVEARQAYKEQIQELRELKSQLKGVRNRARINREEKKLNRRLKKLQASEVKMMKEQKSIMYPEYKVDLKRQALLSRVGGRIEYFEEKMAVNDELERMLDQEHHFGDGIRRKIYDIKGAHYQKRLAREQEVLEAMQKSDSIIEMRGARITTISNKYADRIRQNHEEQMTAQMTV